MHFRQRIIAFRQRIHSAGTFAYLQGYQQESKGTLQNLVLQKIQGSHILFKLMVLLIRYPLSHIVK